jgi:endonuclease/exonuclease/phosphatase family metal-dependent hydrolase
MRCAVIALASVLALAGCADAGGGSLTLRVMTYNIHHGEGTDGVFDLARLAAVIAAQDPDLVALQEVDRGTSRASGVDQAAELARLTGMHHLYGAAMPYQAGEYGEAILSRWPIEEAITRALPKIEGSEPRALVVIGVHPADPKKRLLGPIYFAGTHLAHDSGLDTLEQARLIASILSSPPHDDATIILAGDLNAPPPTPTMAYLLEEAGYRDAFADDPRPTFPSGAPDRRIDWILLRAPPGLNITVVGTEVIDDPIATDHCAVVADIVIDRR